MLFGKDVNVRDDSSDCLMKINSGYVFLHQILLPKTLEME